MRRSLFGVLMLLAVPGFAQQLSVVLHRERGDELSTSWEERLPELVRDVVARAVHSSGRLGVSPVLAARLAECGTQKAPC